jgi:hypothetical protein
MLTWYGAGAVAAIVIAWVAAVLQASVRAPVGSISIGVGLMLAIMLSTLAMLAKLRPSRSLIVGTFVLAAVAVLAQHAWLYIDYRRQWQEALAKAPKFSEFPAKVPSPTEYFSQELTLARGALWCVDAVLIIGAAFGAMQILERKRREFGMDADVKVPNPKP